MWRWNHQSLYWASSEVTNLTGQMVSDLHEDFLHIPCSHSVASMRAVFLKQGAILPPGICTGQHPPNQELSAPHVHSAEVEKPCASWRNPLCPKVHKTLKCPLSFPWNAVTVLPSSNSLARWVLPFLSLTALCLLKAGCVIKEDDRFYMRRANFLVGRRENLLKQCPINVSFKSSLSFLPKRQISPNQGEQGKEETGCIYWKPQRMLGKFGSRSRCPLGGGRCLQCHRKTSSVARPVSSAELLKGRHKNGIRQK